MHVEKLECVHKAEKSKDSLNVMLQKPLKCHAHENKWFHTCST